MQNQHNFLVPSIASSLRVRNYSIDLSLINIPQFEKLLQQHLEQNTLRSLTFNREFTAREQQIIVNLYVASFYRVEPQRQTQLHELALKYNINLHAKFNYLVNVNKHDIELDGLGVVDFYNGFAQHVIDNLNNKRYFLLYEAIYANNLRAIKHLVALGVSLSVHVNGRLPLELACELGYIDLVKYFLYTCKVNVLLLNVNGLHALHQACMHNQTEIVFELVKSKKFALCDFLDVTNSNYDPSYDIVKIVIDCDNSSMLYQMLNIIGKSKDEKDISYDYLLSMYNYAAEYNKLRIMHYLNAWLSIAHSEQTKLMNAVVERDLTALSEILPNKRLNECMGGKYLAEVACELGYIDILEALLHTEEPKLQWYDYKAEFTKGYTKKLDLIRLAIKKDNPELLDVLLKNLDGDSAYVFENQDRQQKIRSKALRLKKQRIVDYLDHFSVIRQEHIIQFFEAANSGDSEMILEKLDLGININLKFEGKTIAHVLCENNRITALEILIANQLYNIDINIADNAGNYPLTLACVAGNTSIVRKLLRRETTRYYWFDETARSDYESKLDPIKIAIDHNNVEMLESVLNVTTREHRNIISVQNLTPMLNYARQKNSPLIIRQLERYINLVYNGRPVFDTHLNTDLQNTIRQEQSISRVETSFIASIKQVCAYFNIQIVDSESGTHKVLKSKYNMLKIFKSLERMIDEAQNTNYKIYQDKNKKVESPFYIVSDEVYRSYAKSVYKKFLPLDSVLSDIKKWRTAWFNDESEELQLSSGLSVLEVWSLAILCARDIYALDGKVLTNQEIKDREQILVRGLVECARAYNCNNDEMIDYGGEPQHSCSHGIAIRAFLCLSQLHKKIVMLSNPIEWAAEVAERVMLELFQTNPDKAYIAECYHAQAFQLSDVQKKALKTFYSSAFPIVNAALLKEIGLVRTGGYLMDDDLKKVLANIEYIPLVNEQKKNSKNFDKIFSAPVFTVVDGLICHDFSRHTPLDIAA